MAFDRTKFTSLLVLAIAGAVLLVAAAITDAIGMTTLAGFLTLYAVVALLLSGVGYASVFSIKLISKVFQRRRVNASATRD